MITLVSAITDAMAPDGTMARMRARSTLDTLLTFGIPPTHPATGFGYIERGEYNLSVDLALRLCRALDVSLDALFSAEPFPPLSNAQLTAG